MLVKCPYMILFDEGVEGIETFGNEVVEGNESNETDQALDNGFEMEVLTRLDAIAEILEGSEEPTEEPTEVLTEEPTEEPTEDPAGESTEVVEGGVVLYDSEGNQVNVEPERSPILFAGLTDNTPYFSSEVQYATISDLYTMVLSLRNIVLIALMSYVIFKFLGKLKNVLYRIIGK